MGATLKLCLGVALQGWLFLLLQGQACPRVGGES